MHGAPFQWASIFHKEDINFTKGHHDLAWYDPTSKKTTHHLPCKVQCGYCKTPIMDEGRNMILLFPTLIEDINTKEDSRTATNATEKSLVRGNAAKFAGTTAAARERQTEERQTEERQTEERQTEERQTEERQEREKENNKWLKNVAALGFCHVGLLQERCRAFLSTVREPETPSRPTFLRPVEPWLAMLGFFLSAQMPRLQGSNLVVWWEEIAEITSLFFLSFFLNQFSTQPMQL
ncbi:hypothetical protein QBC38DRAFT_88102 [Podospora fimiseda]|uniref:Uncharacterized protein n=1 Tax=Podospora fimiseda TaxID=252190 RepID=A0AAN6YPT3_9PEZI|nr:hypothetical protein QBC38DRAFT_88102 [Podospora fimiseda]